MNSPEKKVLFKNYQVIKTLSKNEYNEILLAQLISGNKKVVLKQSSLLNGDISRVSKLGHEYDVLKDLDHPGIPKVDDFLFDGKMASLVVEYFDGSDLRNLVFKRKLNYSEVIELAIQLAGVLQYLHQKGIIHKDINPRNILITNEGNLKLIDFGISSNLWSEAGEILNPDKIEGTLNYISPEQTGRTAYSVTHTSDFYSFGILLYELLAEKLPFDSVDPLEVIHFHLSRKPYPLSTILPDLPDGLEQIINKLLKKNPDERYHSAAGLKADLELIKTHYLAGKKIDGFKPGWKDITRQYKQTQKLYGREREIGKLVGYYNHLHIFKSMMVLVAGYSGVGKSALIKHVKFPIIQNNGTFISGKFDQFKKDIPYYAFIEAIKEFIKNLLAEPEDKINEWKLRINSVLGENAGLITDVIPQLSLIIGKQPAVPKLQPAEQESRFNMVLLDFIYVFSTFESPLVIFLDDLQWADLPSLSLVKRILENPREDRVMLIGSYRDNEVDKGHPLSITLRQLAESGAQVKSIHLEPLNRETTNQITADSFGMNYEKAEELGRHVFIKTKGNPFFIHSFLKSLFEKNLVKSDMVKQWTWNQLEIDELGYTDNVIDLMTRGLTDLPMQTQEVLQYAAVLGNTFSFSELVNITENTKPKVYSDLKPAIKGGFINSHDTSYRTLELQFYQTETAKIQTISSENVEFTFTHDKVQQAAYNLIPEKQRPQVHLKIGRLLLKSRDEEQLQDDIFEVVNHFGLSYQLISDEKEKERIAGLCLTAGKKAKDSTSYSLGVSFLNIARNLFGENNWNDNYDLTYNVLLSLGECEYLNDNLEKAEDYFKEILNHAKTRYDKLKVYALHTALYLKIGDSQKALEVGSKAAKLYNIKFPKNKKLIELYALLKLTKYLILFSTKYRKPEDFSQIKESEDEENIALNRLMIDVASSAYMHDQNLMMIVVLKIIKMYLKHGSSDASGWGFSGLSVVVLSGLKMQSKGMDLWKLTLELNKKTKSPLIKWRLIYLTSAFGNPWRTPFRDDFQNIEDTIKACVLNGDQIFTGYGVSLYQRYRFIAGVNLDELIGSSEEHIPLIKNAMGGFDFFQCFHQMAKGINGRTNDDNWEDETFDAKAALRRIEAEGNQTKLGFFHTAKLVSLFYYEKYAEAIEENKLVIKYKDNFIGELCEVLHAFYTALSISAVYDEFSPKEKKSHLKTFKSHLKNVKYWSKGIPENYKQHLYLLQAELFSMNNDFEKAIENYEKAIETAGKNNFVYVKAIANEKAASLCKTKQLDKQTQLYINAAWSDYNYWGATTKCKKLEAAYPEYFKENTVQPDLRQTRTATSFSSSTALDLASVVKASQTIASQVKYEDVLKSLLKITIENAGAERGYLLLGKGDQLYVEALGISGSEDIEILPSVPLSEVKSIPISVINYCWRSEEIVVENDALNEGQFTADPCIIENGILSVMCLPISAVGKMSGLLYLENRLIKGVFNKNRIDLLQMLSGQIGISIENAILYGNLEEKVQERTKEIEKTLAELKATQAQLIQSEKMASLGELTAGIAHEIQNPLNFVNNFSEISSELIAEMKEELEESSRQYAAGSRQSGEEKLNLAKEIAEDIKQNLEKINHHSKRASSIVKGMLEHSRTGGLKKELTDINKLADEFLRLAYHGLQAKNNSDKAGSVAVTIETHFDPTIPKINVIPQDIGRVLLNLINNAFYAVDKQAKSFDPLTPEGGTKNNQIKYVPTVTISTTFLNPPSGGRGVRIVVKDNGDGIPSHIVDKIFQPFFTTKPTGQGTGLGLSLAYDIVKAHGGELKVETFEGEGSEFIIIIPITKNENNV
jgi:histidine kinase